MAESIDARGAHSIASVKKKFEVKQGKTPLFSPYSLVLGVALAVLVTLLWFAFRYFRAKPKLNEIQKTLYADEIGKSVDTPKTYLTRVEDYMNRIIAYLKQVKKAKNLTPEEKALLFSLEKEEKEIQNFLEVTDDFKKE